MSRPALTIFESLRAELAEPALATLRIEVRAHLAKLVAVQQREELVAIDLAELLAARLDGLLADSAQLSSEARADVVGAARYFVSATDAQPDTESCTGLDDDVAVFNHVAARIGRPDLRIDD